MTFRNPYVVGNPIENSDQYFGQERIITEIKNSIFIENRHNVILYGQRRIGKTSTLKKILRESPEDFSSIFIDISMIPANFTVIDLLFVLTYAMSKKFNFDLPIESEFKEKKINYFENVFLKKIFNIIGDNNKILLIVDEFDVFSENNDPKEIQEIHEFFSILQNLTGSDSQVFFLFAIGQRPQDLPKTYSVLFRQGIYVKISYLLKEDAYDLIQKPLASFRKYAEEAVNRIWQLTHGHAYLINFLCSIIFSNMRDSEEEIIESEEVNNAIPQLLERATVGLNWFWDGFSIQEHFILSAIAESVEIENGLIDINVVNKKLEQYKSFLENIEISTIIERLVQLDLLEWGGDYFSFKVEVIRQWIITNHPFKSALKEADTFDKVAALAVEKAHELVKQYDYNEAIEEYNRALKKNPYMLTALLGLGRAYLKNKNFQAAVDSFQKVYDLSPTQSPDDYIDALLNYGYELRKRKKLDEALNCYNIIIEKLNRNNSQAQERIFEIINEKNSQYIDDGNWPAAWNFIETNTKKYQNIDFHRVWWIKAREFNLRKRALDSILMYKFLIEKKYEVNKCKSSIEESINIYKINGLDYESELLSKNSHLFINSVSNSLTLELEESSVLKEQLTDVIQRDDLIPETITIFEETDKNSVLNNDNINISNKNIFLNLLFKFLTILIAIFSIMFGYFILKDINIINISYIHLRNFINLFFILIAIFYNLFILNNIFKNKKFLLYFISWTYQIFYIAIIFITIILSSNLKLSKDIMFLIIWITISLISTTIFINFSLFKIKNYRIKYE